MGVVFEGVSLGSLWDGGEGVSLWYFRGGGLLGVSLKEFILGSVGRVSLRSLRVISLGSLWGSLIFLYLHWCRCCSKRFNNSHMT